MFYNDPAIINTRYERIASLKIEDLQRVARQYLVPANRAVVVTVTGARRKPGATAAAAQSAGGATVKTRFCALPSALCSVSGAARRAGAAARPGRASAPPAPPQFKGKAPVSNEVIKVKLPRAQETQLSNGAYLMVLEDHRVPSVQFEIIMIGAGGYYDPPGMPGPRRHDRVADGRRHDDEELRADRAGARHDGGDRVRVGERGIADCDGHRLGADRPVRSRCSRSRPTSC